MDFIKWTKDADTDIEGFFVGANVATNYGGREKWEREEEVFLWGSCWTSKNAIEPPDC